MKKNFLLIANIITILFILALPYWIFEGKLFVGGDDTRLLYVYPIEFIKNISFFSWHNVSTIGINSPDQFLLPFLVLWSFLYVIIPFNISVAYLALSIPMIIGLLFFQKSVKELFYLESKNYTEIYLGSIFYIFSPILILDQYFIFLTTIWLIALIPLEIYLFTKYIRTSNFIYVFISAISCIVFSAAMYSVPWILGFLLPLVLATAVIGFFLQKKFVKKIFLKSIIFFGYIFMTQLFWIGNFLASFIFADINSYAQRFVSKGFVDTFTPTVNSTATGNIFYPMLNLFHRQIAFDFSWHLKEVFLNYYDITVFFSLIISVVFFIGLLHYRKNLSVKSANLFIFFSVSWIFSLYFFTVNIPILKEAFLLFGKIPGFLMFRNFYDKFSLGFILIYAILFTASMVIVRKKIKYYKFFFLLTFIVIIINFYPVKQTVNSPLWTTKSVYRTIIFPQEYLDTMDYIKKNVPPTTNILNLPFSTSIYSVVKDQKTDNVYVGTSPVRILSGVNDISGHYSFNFTDQSHTIDELMHENNIKKINEVLYAYNINYVLFTKNIPDEVKNAWIFDNRIINMQNDDFLQKITSRKLYTSSDGNYSLYATKKTNSIIKGENVIFKKISPVKYKIQVKNLKKQDLLFLDSFHAGWKIYLEKYSEPTWCVRRIVSSSITECYHSEKLMELEDLKYIFRKDVFKNTHKIYDNFANEWTLDKDMIIKDYDNIYYKLNSDGSIDIKLTLYFLQQNYFYYGSLISAGFFVTGFVYLLFFYVKKNSKVI